MRIEVLTVEPRLHFWRLDLAISLIRIASLHVGEHHRVVVLMPRSRDGLLLPRSLAEQKLLILNDLVGTIPLRQAFSVEQSVRLLRQSWPACRPLWLLRILRGVCVLRRVVSAILLVQKWLSVVQMCVREVGRHGPAPSVCCKTIEKVESNIVKSKYGRLNLH